MTWGIRPWLPEEDAQLRRMWCEGSSASEIAKALDTDRSRCAVIGRVHRLGLPGRAAPSMRTYAPKVGKRRAELAAVSVIRTEPPKVAPTPEEVQAAFADAPSSARPLAECGPDECRWPFGERGSYLFCCRPTAEGAVYCADHARIAHQPPKPGSGVAGLTRSLRRYI